VNLIIDRTLCQQPPVAYFFMRVGPKITGKKDLVVFFLKLSTPLIKFLSAEMTWVGSRNLRDRHLKTSAGETTTSKEQIYICRSKLT